MTRRSAFFSLVRGPFSLGHASLRENDARVSPVPSTLFESDASFSLVRTGMSESHRRSSRNGATRTQTHASVSLLDGRVSLVRASVHENDASVSFVH
jgi:hypothetical protein